MRDLTRLAAVGIITSLVFTRAQAAPGQAKPRQKPDTKPTASRMTPADDQGKSGSAGAAADAASDKAKPDDAKTGNAQSGAPAKRSVREILNARVPEVSFEAAPLEKVIEWVQDYTGLLVYVRWPALEEFAITRETPITVKARDKKLSQILWVVMNEAAGASRVTLAYQASNELILLSTHDDLRRSMVTRVYDVKDIIVDVPDFPDGKESVIPRTRVRRVWPATESMGADIGTEGRQPPRREIICEDEALHEFMELILNTVEPETWEINGMGGHGAIFPYKGRLVVRNSIHVHQIIAGRFETDSEED